MADLVALDLPAGPGFVDELRRAWDAGDAVLPVDRRLPPAAKAGLLAAMRPAVVVDERGRERLPGGVPVEPGDALVMATSGSTGPPKGVVLTHDAVVASARATSRRLGVGPGDHWLACLPLAHVGGLSVVTRALVTGTPLTVLAGFDPDAVVGAARAGATLVSLVATAMRRIPPEVFRCIVLGGAAPPPVLPPNAVTTYGMTETGSGIVYDGVPLDGVEVDVRPGGDLRVRAQMLLRAYRDGTVPLDADGWFATGDVGRLDESGRLVVQGRRGELIITGGENVWPEPVEAVLRAHPAVADVVVVGEPDPEWGHRVVAVVVPAAAPPTLAELRSFTKERLAPFCAPRRLVVTTAIPRTALGKPRRDEVRRSLLRCP